MQPTKLYLLRQTKPRHHSLGMFTDFDTMLQAAKSYIESHNNTPILRYEVFYYTDVIKSTKGHDHAIDYNFQTGEIKAVEEQEGS